MEKHDEHPAHVARLSQAVLTSAACMLMCLPLASHALQYNETYDIFFMNIEDPEDASDDDGLRFGGNLNKFLYYDKDQTRFTFTDDLHVTDGITASGTLVTDGRNTFNGVSVFNESGLSDSHVRMESGNEVNMFFLDATNDRIGIGTSTPDATLDVLGALSGVSIYSFGLSDCDNAASDKLLWDASTGTFSCGTDQSGGGGGGSTSYISVTTQSNSTASSAEYDVFQSSSYSALSTVTNASSGITYTSADGRFTVDADGVYSIGATFIMNGSSSNLVNVIVKVNGSPVYSHDVYVHSSVDPVTRSVRLLYTLAANDYVEYFVDSVSSNSISTYDGTTANIFKVN